MRRDQAFHERLIPLLCEGLGVGTYLEIGTDMNQTIGKVTAPVRIGVDPKATDLAGCIMFRMTCDQFVLENAAQLAPFDFVFIDADHRPEMVRSDFINLWPYVAADGVVALHDTNPETASDTGPGLCDNAWMFAFYAAAGGFESMTLPYCPGLTLIRKRSKWGVQ